jgi:ankyrin repeat protein
MKREEKGNNHNKTDNTHNNTHARTGSHTHLGGKVEQVIKKFGGSLHNAKTAVNHHKQTDSSTHNPDNDLELRTLIGLIESTQENTAILHLNNLDIDVINREIKGGKTLLHLAAKHELDFLVKELLVKMEQTFIERKDITGKRALHYAAISGNKTVVELLIPKIPFKDVGAFDASGKTALHYVIKNTGNYGQEREVSERTYKEIVEMLIKRMPLESIKASTRDNTGKTALQLAIDHNKQEAAKLLHTKIGFTDIAYVSKSDGKTALHSALLYKQEEVADLLWKKIVDSKNNRDITIKDIEKLINHSDEKGNTLLHCAIKGNIPSIAGNIITFLSSHKIITQEDNEGTTPLILATQNEDFKDAAMTMIAKFPKALIGAKVDGNLSVAHYAAREGNEKVLEQLVKNQPKHVQIIEFTTKDGNTLLHYAALNGHLEAVNFLISKMHPGLIKVPNKNGYTALHYAAQIGHTEVVGALLESMDGKNISAATYKSHYTPLMLAINKNHEEVAKMLVSKMSVKDLKIIDRHGNTATDLATKKDFGDLASLINDKIGHSHHHHDSEGKGKQAYYESDGENTTTPTNVKFKLSTPVGQQPHTIPIQHQWKELATKAVALQQEKKDLSTNTTKKTSATETTRGLIDKAEDALKTVT